VRRSVSRAEIAALKKRTPAVELNPIAVIVRTIVDPSSADVPRTVKKPWLNLSYVYS
jgi:hypothetical protein